MILLSGNISYWQRHTWTKGQTVVCSGFISGNAWFGRRRKLSQPHVWYVHTGYELCAYSFQQLELKVFLWQISMHCFIILYFWGERELASRSRRGSHSWRERREQPGKSSDQSSPAASRKDAWADRQEPYSQLRQRQHVRPSRLFSSSPRPPPFFLLLPPCFSTLVTQRKGRMNRVQSGARFCFLSWLLLLLLLLLPYLGQNIQRRGRSIRAIHFYNSATHTSSSRRIVVLWSS